MPVGGQEVDRRLPHVERKYAEALDGIDEEENAAFPAHLAQGVQIVAKAAGVFDEAQADNARAAIDGGGDVVERQAIAPARHRPHLDAAPARLSQGY